MASKPWQARPFHLPSRDQWLPMARVVVARVAHPDNAKMAVICACGFPESHSCRGMNEEMLMDVFASMEALTMPTTMGGDLNAMHTESSATVLSEALGIVHVSPKKSPTMRRDGGVSASMPIDHVFMAFKVLNITGSSRVNYAVTLSDHYPAEVCMCSPPGNIHEIGWPA